MRWISDESTTSPTPTLALPRPNETDVHECLSSGRQKCGSHKGQDLGWTEDVEVFPSQISQAYPSPDCQYRDRRMIPSDSILGILALWYITVLQRVSTMLHTLGGLQAEGPCRQRRRSSWLYWYLYGQLWISLAGENWGVSIVGCAICSWAQNGGTTFRPLWWCVTEMHSLLQGNKWFRHAAIINHFSFYQLMWNPTACKFFGTADDLW